MPTKLVGLAKQRLKLAVLKQCWASATKKRQKSNDGNQ